MDYKIDPPKLTLTTHPKPERLRFDVTGPELAEDLRVALSAILDQVDLIRIGIEASEDDVARRLVEQFAANVALMVNGLENRDRDRKAQFDMSFSNDLGHFIFNRDNHNG